MLNLILLSCPIQVCDCLPYLSDSGRSVVVLSDVASCITMLSLTNLESQYMEIGEQWEEKMSQWVINTFIRCPFKQAKKQAVLCLQFMSDGLCVGSRRAGGSYKCFPVIRAITAALSEWPQGLGVRRSIKLCLKHVIRIIEHGSSSPLIRCHASSRYWMGNVDKLVLTAREGFGILCDCISVLSTDIPEDVVGKLLSWALEGSKHSSVWEVGASKRKRHFMHMYAQHSAFLVDPVLRNQDHKIYSAITVRRRRRSRRIVKVKRSQHLTSLSSISRFLGSCQKRMLFQVLKDANSDRNRQVKDLAKEVLEHYNHLRKEKGICPMTSKASSSGSKSCSQDHDGPSSAHYLYADVPRGDVVCQRACVCTM